MSYNVNEAQKEAQFTVSSIFAQQNSGKSRLAENSSFSIPASSWRKTPNRRMCSGSGSYLFDLRYAIATSENPSPITVWIEYDVTFHTPQIEPTSDVPIDQGIVLTGYAGQVFSKPEAVTAESDDVTWTVEGSFDGLIASTGHQNTAPTSDKEGYSIAITYEDSTTGSINVELLTGNNSWTYTYTGITGYYAGTSYDSPMRNDCPLQFYETGKKISKIEVSITSSSMSYMVIAPY
jgi:hypothetical protein